MVNKIIEFISNIISSIIKIIKKEKETKMPFLIVDGEFVIVNNKFVLSDSTFITKKPGKAVTAEGVEIGFLNSTEEAAYKLELAEDYGEALSAARFVRLMGSKVGVQNFKVDTEYMEGYAPFIMLLRKSDGTWTELFNDIIPGNSVVTVTLPEFGPVVGIPGVYLSSSDFKILYADEDDYLSAKEED